MRKRVFRAMALTALTAAALPLILLAFTINAGAGAYNDIRDIGAPLIVTVCLAWCAFAAIAVSRAFTRRVVEPINSIDLDGGGDVYDELMPLMHRIKTAKAEITAQRAAADERAAEISYITENMREGIILISGTGAALLANKSVLRVLGVKEAVGRSVFELVRETGFIKAVKEVLEDSGGDPGFSRVVPHNIGDRAYSVSISKTPPAGAAVLFIDITDKLSAEVQRREFSANVSHELKTPLTTIRALSEMIENGAALPGDIASFAAKISKNAKRLSNIVDDVIRLSEFDEGKQRDDFAPFDMRALADSVAGAFKEKAGERGITLSVSGRHFVVSANRGMFDELIYNLLDNAIKYNSPGGSVSLEVSSGGGGYAVSVADTGIGIADEHKARVFERFYRVDKSRSKETGGTGLGLSIVKHIAEFHSGRVSIESNVGEGTRITCSFMN